MAPRKSPARTQPSQGSEAAGLALRPLSDTLATARHWEIAREDAGPNGAGLTDSYERELLAALARARAIVERMIPRGGCAQSPQPRVRV